MDVSKILYAGVIERGFWIEGFAKKQGAVFAHVEQCLKIADQVNPILRFGRQDYTVFDLKQYVDDAGDIAYSVDKICEANNSKAIILASGFPAKSQAVAALRKSGIRYFVFAIAVEDMLDEFEKCLNGYFDVDEPDRLKEAEKEEKRVEAETANIRMIGVAGALRRMGTTTHAVQIVKYLMMKGYRAAYIQMNSSEYIQDIRAWFNFTETDADRAIGRIIYENVDHFYLPEKIPEVLKLGYDFYVYDYGTYFDPQFNRVSFLEKDFRIFVVGSDPTELHSTYEIVKSVFYDDVKYIFNFVNEAEKNDIYDLMDDKKKDCFIAGYIPDKYVLTDASGIYDKIIACGKKPTLASTDGKRRKWVIPKRSKSEITDKGLGDDAI